MVVEAGIEAAEEVVVVEEDTTTIGAQTTTVMTTTTVVEGDTQMVAAVGTIRIVEATMADKAITVHLHHQAMVLHKDFLALGPHLREDNSSLRLRLVGCRNRGGKRRVVMEDRLFHHLLHSALRGWVMQINSITVAHHHVRHLTTIHFEMRTSTDQLMRFSAAVEEARAAVTAVTRGIITTVTRTVIGRHVTTEADEAGVVDIEEEVVVVVAIRATGQPTIRMTIVDYSSRDIKLQVGRYL